MSDSVQPHRQQPNRLPRPWDSPGKNTGVGCHVLLQCMKVKSESEVAQSYPTLSHPMDCSPPGSSVHGFSRQEYWSGVPLPSPFLSHALYQMSVCYLYFFCPGNSILVCVLVAQLCPTLCDPMECSPTRLLCPWNSPDKSTEVGSPSILQEIFLTQGSNLVLLHYKQILYRLSHSSLPACLSDESLQLCPTLCDPMDRSLLGSSVHGILQARILEWIAIPFCRGSSPPRD